MRDDDWFDVTVPVHDGMLHWPDDPPVRIESALTHAQHGVAVSRLLLGSHTGTHVDAPLHFIKGGAGVDRMPLQLMSGPVRIAEMGDASHIGRKEVERIEPRPGERLLLRTANTTRKWWAHPFARDYVALDGEAAALLAERGVHLVGIDHLSVAAASADAAEVHRTLMQAGVWIVEGLDLSSVEAGPWQMLCLPLRIEGGDGAPARVLLRPLAPKG